MKNTEHKKAIELRKQGLTYSEINKLLGVSKGSLSQWLKTTAYMPREDVLKRRRLASVQNGQVLHQRKMQMISEMRAESKQEINSVSYETLRLLGILAYWCEGSKTKDSIVKFTNSDERLVQLMMRWFREVCKVPEEKLRIHLRIHQNTNQNVAKKHWAEITGVSLQQFHKITLKESESHGTRINQLSYGIASIIVCDTSLFYRIQGWIEALSNIVCENGTTAAGV